MFLLHVATESDWADAQAAGCYEGSTYGRSLAEVGFVHASASHAQLDGVLRSFYADVREQDVQFLGLNVKETSEQFALAFVDRFGIEFPSLYDPRGEVALAFRDYPATAIPSTIVLDRESRVAAVYTGEVSQENLRATLDRVLEEG